MTTVLLKNAAFKAAVNRYIRLYAPDKVVVITTNGASTDVDTITMEQLVEYSRSPISIISPIRVVKQSSTVQDITTITTVSGWAQNKVVLRPLGEQWYSVLACKGSELLVCHQQGYSQWHAQVVPHRCYWSLCARVDRIHVSCDCGHHHRRLKR